MRAIADPHSPRLPAHTAGDRRRLLFGNFRDILHTHTLATDAAIATVLLGLSTGWLVWVGPADWEEAVFQLAIIGPLAWRRSHPSAVFCVMAALGLAQWLLGYRLIGAAALLVALYTVAVHESRARAMAASAVMEIGAVMAATRWRPAATVPRSFLFLTATVVASLFAGLTVRSGSEYMGWLAERAERLEIERDQQASLGAAAERARIAREMHDIVAHSLSVVVTLADAASIASRSDPVAAGDAMEQVSRVGRQALTDMRSLMGVLRTSVAVGSPGVGSPGVGVGSPGVAVGSQGDSGAELSPMPTIDRIDDLARSVRSTGLAVSVAQSGAAFAVGAGVELTLYRIAQEALTNTLKHAGASKVAVTLNYDRPRLELRVTDDGSTPPAPEGAKSSTNADLGTGGHGIQGMRERARLHGGTLVAGPAEGGGWVVSATVFDTTTASEAIALDTATASEATALDTATASEATAPDTTTAAPF
ncbi:MAG: sensor histidine kinase [Acidimicrobiales bacterium]